MNEVEWKPTACNLCYANCGVLVQLDESGRKIVKVRGDKSHPVSRGYTCNKALSLDYYQNGRDRLDNPLRRRDDGTFEAIGWDVAIAEIAERLSGIRDTVGGDKIMYYGGGGQGNHLGGSYANSVQKALGVRYRSNALAQEKTGLAWMNERMLSGLWHGDFEHCDVAIIIGKNPWQSNGLQRARVLMRDLSKDPDRTLIVLDPRRSETADLADIHLAVRPGTDVWCIAAILGHLVQNNMADTEWLAEHTTGHEAVLDVLQNVPVSDYAGFAGISMAEIEAVAGAMAATDKVAVYEDLGVEMSPHSTLCSFLNILLFLIRGSFAKPGGTHLTAPLVSLFSLGASAGQVNELGYEEDYKTSPVTGARLVCGLMPCNSIPAEILTDHPDRIRAMIVESANPAHSLADSEKFREAFAALDVLVVIDVAMTETARLADYVLPAPSQYEKYEATFFNFEYPDNFFHLRRPLMAPRPGTLPEPEIHARLTEALGVFEDGELDDLSAAAREGLEAYGMQFFRRVQEDKKVARHLSYVLYRTLGPTLPDGASAAASLWGLCQMHARQYPDAVRAAGFAGEGIALGNSLFRSILASPSGTVISRCNPDQAEYQWRKPDGKVHVNVAEMVDELGGLGAFDLPERSDMFPLILAAGERRSHTANTAIRDPQWMKSNNPTALAVNPLDARSIGLADASRARLVTKRGSAEVIVTVDDRMQEGTLSMPNGLGIAYPDAQGNIVRTGVSPNELTDLDDRDRWVGTPWHKHVRARLEPIG